MRKPKLKHITILVFLGAASYSAYFIWQLNQHKLLREGICFETINQKLESGIHPDSIFEHEFADLQLLVEYSLIARSEMLDISGRIRADRNAPISSRDLLTLKSGTEDYLEIREGLYRIAEAYECAIDVREQTLLDVGVDPLLRTKAVLLSLSAALTLYDNYMLGALIFEEDNRLRRIVNDPDMGFGLVSNKLQEMTLAASSVENRHRIRRAITFFEEQRVRLEGVDEDSDLAYLVSLIDSSPSYNYIKKIQVGEVATKKLDAFGRITDDWLADIKTEGFDVMSGLFGNTVGLYESRRGMLYGRDSVLRHVQSVLRPLDILLEKTPFRLTDKLIPGHFGHVAIWIGTRSELQENGVWDELVVEQYHDQISDPGDPCSKDEHQVVEALRNGVQLSTLEHFLNVDDLIILRPIFPDSQREQLTREALLLAFRQVGKKYDFNFDVNTTDKIVCSELAYVSFPSVDWPTEKTLGRYTISPDNVAQMARNNIPLELVMFYHDGKLVDPAVRLEIMSSLLDK